MSSLDNKSILVTGGTGSFGRKFIETVLQRYKPARLVIYSRDEFKQYEMEQALSRSEYPCLRYFIGDVRDLPRLKRALNGIDIVIHAAALKHVPVAEYNPSEAIKTNVIGSEYVIEASIDAGVERVLALSTDKAVNPVNLYGATKLCADKLFIAANNLVPAGQGTIFSVVRYGNVLGSRGSVLPLFLRLLKEGHTELPITDPNMTRFWLSLQDGVDFVIRCLADMQGGETCVPKIPTSTIVTLAEAIRPGIATRHVGIRVGEKLHEMMVTAEDSSNTVEFDDRYIIKPTGVVKYENRDYLVNGNPGAAVEPGFVYSSDTAKDRLDAPALRRKVLDLGFELDA